MNALYDINTYIAHGGDCMELLKEIAEKVEAGRQNEVKALVESGIERGIAVSDILNGGLVAGMNSIGIKFRENEVFVPEVLVAARAMKAGLEIIKPILLREKVAVERHDRDGHGARRPPRHRQEHSLLYAPGGRL